MTRRGADSKRRLIKLIGNTIKGDSKAKRRIARLWALSDTLSLDRIPGEIAPAPSLSSRTSASRLNEDGS